MSVGNAMLLCSLAELTDPGAREFTLGEGDWPLRGFVVRYQGEVHAYLNSCPHAGLPLNFKPDVFFAPHVELLQCVAHGALFEPETGECVAGPCFGQSLQMLDIQVHEGRVYLRSHPDILESYWA
ncbi:MAG: Rieske (2Fe-2S) protein [Steroidobacteraceae bacterium]